jgi:hypothetical protein
MVEPDVKCEPSVTLAGQKHLLKITCDEAMPAPDQKQIQRQTQEPLNPGSVDDLDRNLKKESRLNREFRFRKCRVAQ